MEGAEREGNSLSGGVLPFHRVLLESGHCGHRHLLRLSTQLLPSCTRNKGLQIRTWKPTKIPEDRCASHVHNLMPNLHVPLVYPNPSFPEDAVPSLIPSTDGLHLPK